MRRQQLTETQIAALFDPPTDPRELIRHYTLSADDLAIVHRCRGEHNRLGRALMLCYLRYPGRPLRAGERPPAVLTAFVAEQIDALPTAMEAYLAAERNRQRHAVECQERLRLRLSGNTQRRSSPIAFIRKPLKGIASSTWPSWSWRSAAGGGSSFRRRGVSSAFVLTSAFGRGGRSSDD